MNLLNSIKKSLYTKELAKKAKQGLRKRNFKGLSAAENYGIVFEYSGLFEIKSIEKLTQKLRNKGRNVHLLCYTGKDIKTDLAFKTFSNKDLSFNMIPKSNVVDEFTNRHVDILYNLIPIEKEVSEYITAVSHADFKIGLFSEQKSNLDLMINLKDNNLNEFIKTAEQVLQKTNI